MRLIAEPEPARPNPHIRQEPTCGRVRVQEPRLRIAIALFYRDAFASPQKDELSY